MNNDRKNMNTGSTLIMVIVAIAFIGVLGSFVISMTMINIQMKTIDAQSKENFYTTESSMRDINGSLEEIAAVAMKDAYEEVLTHYVENTRNGKSISNEFDRIYLTNLRDALADVGTTDYYDGSKISSRLNSTSTFMTPDHSLSNGLELSYGDALPANKRYVKLKNIVIEYHNPNNEQLTTIKTDIVMYSPGMAFGTSSSYPEFSKYSLIADDSLITASTNSNSCIMGNIYAGSKGIKCTNGNLALVGSTLITRGDLTVCNNGTLKVGDSSLGSPIYTNIWAENITTEKVSGCSNEANLEIAGSCYVSNDLLLNAPHSKVKVEGKYFGYSFNKENIGKGEAGYSNSFVNSKYSSAIIINGKNSMLDFSTVNAMYLVGHSFVAVPSGTGDSDILMGQSFAAKSDQVIYLVQREYMKNDANPILKTPSLDENDVIEWTRVPHEITDLLSVDKVKKFHYIFNGAEMIYYYWDFKSHDDVNKYFKYITDDTKRKSDFDNAMNMYVNVSTGAGISLPSTAQTGAYMYTTTTGSAVIMNPSFNNSEKPDASITSLCVSTAKEYKARQLNLTQNTPLAPDGDIRLDDKDVMPLFNEIMAQHGTDTVIKYEADNAALNGFDGNRQKKLLLDFEGDGTNDAYVVCVDNKGSYTYSVLNFPVISSQKKGIIIATGDVLIDQNFTGLIISGGKVTITGSYNVTDDINFVRNIIQYGIDHYSTSTPSTNFIHYFEKYKSGTTASGMNVGTADVAASIKYSDWKKNE